MKPQTTKKAPSQQPSYRREQCAQRKQLLLKLLGGKCTSCGTVENLQFDHINPKTKLFTIGASLEKSMEKLIKETNKCQLLCIYCHAEKTNRDNGRILHHGSFAMYINKKCRCQECRRFISSYKKQLYYGNWVPRRPRKRAAGIDKETE